MLYQLPMKLPALGKQSSAKPRVAENHNCFLLGSVIFFVRSEYFWWFIAQEIENDLQFLSFFSFRWVLNMSANNEDILRLSATSYFVIYVHILSFPNPHLPIPFVCVSLSKYAFPTFSSLFSVYKAISSLISLTFLKRRTIPGLF